MGTYAKAGLLSVLVLAVVLWYGWPESRRSEVELPADSPWQSAALDDGRQLLTIERGQRIEASPGFYRLTLIGPDERVEQLTIEVGGELTRLGSPP
jgi:hypothetical protein